MDSPPIVDDEHIIRLDGDDLIVEFVHVNENNTVNNVRNLYIRNMC
jgi:hypothetical protein